MASSGSNGSSSAAESSGGTNGILCRYYMNGCCSKGSVCTFSHDRCDRPSAICKYYLKDQCGYGSRCRFDHVKPKSPQVPKPIVDMRSATSSKRGESSKVSSVPSAGAPGIERPLPSPQAFPLRADAAEFVPRNLGAFSGSKLYSAAAATGGCDHGPSHQSSSKRPKDLLCPYFITGHCTSSTEDCAYTHGDLCDLCLRPCMHPNDPQQNQKHRSECLAEYEKDMEESFAVARSIDKTCGICLEVVLEKKGPPSARRFGILQKCNHVFCLDCIRKWRQANIVEHKMIRACPHCRTVSDFITPSAVWVEEEAEKEKLIDSYKKALNQKSCRYFQRGSGECPFGNKCFYRHAMPDGTVVEGDSPRTMRRRLRSRALRRSGSSSDEVVREYLLWSFLEDRAEGSGSSGRTLADQDTEWLMRMLDLNLNLEDLGHSDTESESSFDFWTPNML